MCVNNILKVNVECRTLLVDHASRFGNNSAFQDDSFTSKKILPGHKPRLSSMRWVRWLSVTNESFHLMLRHVIQKHEAAHESVRSKVTKQKIERVSEMASLVLGITQDVLEAHHGLPRTDIESTFIDGFVNNDPNVIMALESALSDHDKSFDVMSMPILGDVVLGWRKIANDSTAAAPSTMQLKIGAMEIEEHEFKLFKLRVMQDIEQYVSWGKVMKNRETQRYYKRIQHNILRAEECTAAARSLFDPNSGNCRMTLIHRTESNDCHR
jgi:hypothetical protein